MADISTLTIRVDASGATGPLDQVSRKLSEVDAKGAKVGTGLGATLGRAVGPAAALAGALAVVNKAIAESSRAQQVFAQIESGIRSTGGAAGFAADELARYSGELSKVNDVTAEGAQRAQALLLTFTNIRGDTFTDATQGAIDLSAKLGGLESAALQLGKALNDPVRGVAALTRAGVTFTESQVEMIKSLVESGRLLEAQRLILKQVETGYGGAGRAARDTLGGALRELDERFGNLFELSRTDAAPLIDAINAVADALIIVKENANTIVGVLDNILKSNALTAVPRLLAGLAGGALGNAASGRVTIGPLTGANPPGYVPPPAPDPSVTAAQEDLEALRDKLRFLEKNRTLALEIETINQKIAASQQAISDAAERSLSTDGKTKVERQAILDAAREQARIDEERLDAANREFDKQREIALAQVDRVRRSEQELEVANKLGLEAEQLRINHAAENAVAAARATLTGQILIDEEKSIEIARRNLLLAAGIRDNTERTAKATKEVADTSGVMAEGFAQAFSAASGLLSVLGESGREMANIANAAAQLATNIARIQQIQRDTGRKDSAGNAIMEGVSFGEALTGAAGATGVATAVSSALGIVGAVVSIGNALDIFGSKARENAKKIAEATREMERSIENFSRAFKPGTIEQEIRKAEQLANQSLRDFGIGGAVDFGSVEELQRLISELERFWGTGAPVRDGLAEFVQGLRDLVPVLAENIELLERERKAREAEAAAKKAQMQADMDEARVRTTEGFVGRILAAGGNTRAAQDAAISASNRQELADAIRNGMDPTNIALLKFTQFAEAAALVRDRAIEDGTKAINEALDATLTKLDQQIEIERAGLQAAHEQVSTLARQVSTTERLVDSLRVFGAGLTTGGSSPLSPIAQLSDLRRQLGSASDADIPRIAERFLEASRRVNASGAGYAEDFRRVQAIVAAATARTSGQLSLEQLALSEAEKTVAGIEETIRTLESQKEQARIDAQTAVEELIKVQNTIYEMTIQSHEFYDEANALSGQQLSATLAGFTTLHDDNGLLISEIRELRDEVRRMRNDASV